MTFTLYCGVIKDGAVEYLPVAEICEHNRKVGREDFWAVVSTGFSPEEARKNMGVAGKVEAPNRSFQEIGRN